MTPETLPPSPPPTLPPSRWWRWPVRVLVGLLLLVVLVFGGALLALRIPSVQTRVAHRVAALLTEKLRHEVTIGRVDVRPFSRVLLDGVRVLDARRQELFNIGRLDADISVFSVFDPTHLHIGTLRLEEPRFALVTYAGTDSTNLDSFLARLQQLLGPSAPDTTQSTFDFQIQGIELVNGRFILDDQNQKPVAQQPGVPTMDYAHMRLDSIYGAFSGIEIRHDTIRAQVTGVRTFDARANAHLRGLTTRVEWSPRHWDFGDIDLAFNSSHVLGKQVRFDYRAFISGFTHFVDSVRMTVDVHDSRVLGKDLTVFAPPLDELFGRDTAVVTGRATGYVNRNLNVRSLDLAYNRTSHVVGSVALDGVMNWQTMFMDIGFKPGTAVAMADIRKFVPDVAYGYLRPLGTVRARGGFQGYYNDFVANGEFRTAMGDLTSDLNLKIKDKLQLSTYSGTLRTANFQLGRFIGRTDLVQVVSLNGKVQGQGFDIRTMHLTTDVAVARLGLLGYGYRRLTARGTLANQTFTGRVTSADPNLQLVADGAVQFDPRHPAFNFNASLPFADLRALGFSQKAFTVSTTAVVDFEGLTLDALAGAVQLRNTQVRYDTALAHVDSLAVTATRAGGVRTLAIRSELLDLRAAGDYAYSWLIDDLGDLLNEYRLEFQANPDAIARYYARKRRRALHDYRIDLAINLKHPAPLARLFVPGLTLADSTRLDGFFRAGATTIFQLGGGVKYAAYAGTEFTDNQLEINTSKQPYDRQVLADAFVTSRQQVLPGLGATEKLRVEGVWNAGAIDFTSSIRQQKSTNAAQLNGTLDFLTDAVQVRLSPESGANLLNEQWRFARENRLLIAGGGDELTLENFELRNGTQRLSAGGRLSAVDPTQVLTARIDSFSLTSLNSLLRDERGGGLRLGGRVEHARIDLRDAFGNPRFDVRLRVDSLALDGILLGDVRGQADWDNNLGRLGVNAALTRAGRQLVALTGFMSPNAADVRRQLGLVAVAERAPIKLVEPFLGFLFDHLEGYASGRLDISGAFSSPVLRGALDTDSAAFRFGYLNTRYRLSGSLPLGLSAKNDTPPPARIVFDDQGIRLRNLTLRDVFDNTATLDGTVYEQAFQNMRIDLRASFRRFMVLNTTRRENKLYYGTAFGSGRLSISGPVENLTVNVEARTDPGTRLAVPLDNQAEVARSSFITFVSRNPAGDSLRVSAKSDSLQTTGPDLSGLVLNMNLDVTPDAQLEVIFDEETGDIIRGTGQGRVALNIDTRGNFNMYGNVEIVRGLYNFTLLSVVNKEFTIRPGGTVSWNGDPYGGQLNLTATYTQKTSIKPLLEQVAASGQNTNIIIPVVALMDLKGSLLAPEIKLGLDFNNVPGSLESVIQAYANDIRNDDQELNRQVFSLLVLKRLSPRGAFGTTAATSAGSNPLASSVGELLSSQLSYWISQVDSNLEVDLGLAGLDQTALQALQVRVSYSFAQGRLRVTREGGISNATANTPGGGTPVAGTGANAAIGDISVEYYIRPDGRLRLKLAYETTSRDIQVVGTARANGSLVHTQQFDNLSELFRRSKLSRRQQEALRERQTTVIDNDPPSKL